MSMYTLAACNGKTIYTVIHPGDKLTVQQSDVTHVYSVPWGHTEWYLC